MAALNWEGYVHQDYVEFPLTAKTTVAVGVRESPGEQAALVNALFEDTLLLTFQEEDGWLPVIALGQPGYIPTDTLIYPRVAKTTGHVNLRIGSGTEHRILEMLPRRPRSTSGVRRGVVLRGGYNDVRLSPPRFCRVRGSGKAQGCRCNGA